MKAQKSISLGSDGLLVMSLKEKKHIIFSGAFILFPADNMVDFETLKYYLSISKHDTSLDEWCVRLQAQWDEITGSEPTK